MTFQDALQPYLARLRASYARSPLPPFLAWWGAQLRACLPARWAQNLDNQTETLLLDLGDDALTVYRAGDEVPVTTVSRALTADEQRLALASFRQGATDPRVRNVLCLPGGRVLSKRLRMPAAAEENLTQVLAFEMDRQTPFKADQVYMDQRVADRDVAARTLAVEFAVVPKPVLDAALAVLTPLDCPLDGADGWRGAPGEARLGFNFLPPAQRVHRRNLRLRLNLALGAVTVLLLAMVMSQWVANRQAAFEKMTTEVAAMQKQAAQVTALRKGLASSIDGASFLMRKKAASPSIVALLADVTHALPDDTYLERFSVDANNQLTLGGQSAHAATLLEQVGKIKLLSGVNFQGVIQPDARTRKDRFNIAATLVDASVAKPDDARKQGGGRAAKAPN